MVRRKAISVAAALLLASLPALASAQDATLPVAEEPSPLNRQLARQIIDLGFPSDSREELFFASMDQMLLQTREATLKAYDLTDDRAVAILDIWITEYVADSKAVLRSHIPSLMEGMVASYAVMFTSDELADILAFVSTPSGRRFFELSSAIMAEPNFAAANQAYMNEMQAQMPAAMNDLVARLQRYMAEKKALERQAES